MSLINGKMSWRQMKEKLNQNKSSKNRRDDSIDDYSATSSNLPEAFEDDY